MRQDHINGEFKCPVEALSIGQRVDLESDIFADPENDQVSFQYEFEVVADMEVETADCICVYFESGFACGFPPDHLVDVDPEQQDEEQLQ